jgi:mannose-1-phosphate guanylyltransferase
MRALLLAAGLGTRLRPLTDTIPKCMVPIHGVPLLEYWINLLPPSIVEKILINTHYLPDVVSSYVKSSSWCDRIRIVHEEMLLGTGGTILKNSEFFGKDSFFLAHADNLSRFDFAEFYNAHINRPLDTDITMMTFTSDSPKSCGIVEKDDQGRVINFFEKVETPPGDCANGAVYIIESSVIDYLRTKNSNVIDFSTEVIPNYLGKIYCFHNNNYHRDIGTPESLALAEMEF